MFNFFSNTINNQNTKLISQINNQYNILKQYNNIELKQQTPRLIQKLEQNNECDKILVEAFATIKIAIERATSLTLFDVQLISGITLYRNRIAEMKTGEGKTLAAMLPAYLHSLEKKGVHIITVNDYLAKRDAELAKKVFDFLNISIGLVKSNLTIEQKKNQYSCDITYITNNELGFDYLRDNMATNKLDIVQPNFYFGIIDEVDSILIDEARTPLIISGSSEENIYKYQKTQQIANTLYQNLDYDIDEKNRNINLTETGINKCEKILEINDLYNINNPWIKYIINSLKAKEFFIQDKDYIIKDDEIIIVDEFTGRIMEGRRWSDGLHQAIEAKEKLKIQPENKTLASITYQNLFLLYEKLCGMTGTAKTEEIELEKIYNLQVSQILTNKKLKRKDLTDLVYKTEWYKWQAIGQECLDMYLIGRPTLIGTTSIEKSEFLAKILNELQVPYKLLNARPNNVAKEAGIIAQAGRKYSITISTNMAGRGTDIILGGYAKGIAEYILNQYLKKIQNYNFDIILNKQPIIIQNILYQVDTKLILNELRNQSIQELIGTHRQIHDILNELTSTYNIICNQEKEEIIKLGGLYIIGTERHESRRIDNQLRGRSGRQGDPGSSRFFLSLEDNLFRIFGGDKISQFMETLNINENIPIESPVLNQSLNAAQKKVESYFYDIRKQLFEYDEVINNQRQAIYTERKRILESNFVRDCIIEYGESTIDEILKVYINEVQLQNQINILQQILLLLNLTENISIKYLQKMSLNELRQFLYEQLRITYDLREIYLEQLRPGLIRQLEKYYILQQIDQAWQNHLEKMSLLKEAIGWRSYGQQDPLVEYKNEAFNLFINMVIYIRQTVIYLTMRSRLIINLNNQ
uniref:Protein translocase subunit SecA n=1 Tax=Crouania attenuata TaxID=42002 RepID=A0A4D6WUZ3_9FLOR|nr:Preprotein-translocase subunit a [Crouania attenuata]